MDDYFDTSAELFFEYRSYGITRSSNAFFSISNTRLDRSLGTSPTDQS